MLLLPALLLPWAFGGVEQWATSGAALLLVAGAAVALVNYGVDGWGLDRREVAWLVPAALLALWAVVQVLPLPLSLVERISPAAHRIYATTIAPSAGPGPESLLERMHARALERIPEAARVAPREENRPRWSYESPVECDHAGYTLSLWPAATRDALFWYGALLLTFLTVRRRASQERRAAVYRLALFCGFTALAAFALIHAATGSDRLYWARPVMSSARVYGPYVNPAHLAGLLELAVPWMAGYAWARFCLLGRRVLEDPRFLASAIGAAVCLVAGFVAASKAAAALLTLGLVVLLLAGVRSARARLAGSAAALVLLAGALLVLSGSHLAERVGVLVARSQGGQTLGVRGASWEATLEIVRDYPLAGVGFGALRDVYPAYMPRGNHNTTSQVHNDYLEVLVEGGAVGALLLLWLAAGFVWQATRRRRSLVPGAGLTRLGLLLGIASLAAHALVDFNHQIPANALAFVVACALAVPVERDDEAPPEVER